LKLKFEAVRQFDQDERRITEGVLDSLIVQHRTKRLFARSEAGAESAKPASARTEPPPVRGRGKPRATARLSS
jgi:hypothetical protein